MTTDKTIIVIPTYNEASNIAELTQQLLDLPVGNLEVLIVDDNSPDGTGRIADELAQSFRRRVHVLHRPAKNGLASAYIAGLQLTLKLMATRIIQMDADFSHSPTYIATMLEKSEHYDVVIGSRYIQGGAVAAEWELWRKWLSRVANAYARTITGLTVRDTTAGFRCFRREVLLEIPFKEIRSQGYAFCIELTCMCQKRGYRICEIPIVFEERALGRSKLSSSIILEAAWRVWELRHRYSLSRADRSS
jgi:dolichol-phosphate mannosyltransferase